MKFTIKQARHMAGKTQAEMADAMGINRNTYIKIEKDVSRATIGQICRIAEVTEIPVADLILS